MTATTTLVGAARRELSELDGRITGPDDPGYAEARAISTRSMAPLTTSAMPTPRSPTATRGTRR